jgi:hypothetical protein
MSLKRAAFGLGFTLAFTLIGAARAETPEALYEQGWAAMDRKDYPAACALFERSYEASRATGPLQSLAACYEARGFLLQAVELWKSAIEVLPAGSESAAEAVSAVTRLEERLPALTVSLAPGAPRGSRIVVDGEVVTSFRSRWVDPVIEHVIRVSADGHRTSEVRVRLSERERRTVVVAPGPEAPREEGIGPIRGSGIALLVLGGVGFTAAAVTGGLMISDEATIEAGCPGGSRRGCDDDALDARRRAEALSPWNVASWVVGVAATGAGIPMVIVGDGEPASGPRMGLAAGPGSLGFEMKF